jgi:hypothetical protein
MLFLPNIFIVNALKSVGVFDAGSTGTRLHIYSFNNDQVVDFRNFKKEQNKSKGIHLMNDQEVKDEIENLLAMAKNKIKNIKFGFYGTAGMRSITQERANQILNIVNKALENHSLVESKVLSGDDEALYVLKSFEFLNPLAKEFTLIDMGGRSVQIVNRSGNQTNIGSLKLGMTNRTCSKNQEKNKEILKSENENKTSNLKNIDSSKSNLIVNNQLDSTIRITKDLTKALINTASTLNQLENINNLKISGNFEIKLTRCMKINEEVKCIEIYNWDVSKEKNPIIKDIQRPITTAIYFSSLLSKEEEKEKACIQDFFLTKNIEKIKQTGKIYLISAFEYILPTKHTFTLNDLYDLNNKQCSESFRDNCSELYFCLKFLEKIGIEMNSVMEIPNKKEEIAISWVLGKAVELSKF